MDTIKRQVRQAHRRLFWNNLTYSVTWSTFIAFLIALVAIVIPKIWPLGLTDGRVWSIVWLCGAAVVGITGGVVWTLFHRRDELDAAIEIDLRYGLKERVSSALALSPQERESEAGKALLQDAQNRISRIDVREHFQPQFSWHPLLPIVTAIVVFLVAFLVSDATRDKAMAARSTDATTQEQVRKSVAELKKRLAEQQKKSEATGLKDSDSLITRMQARSTNCRRRIPIAKRRLSNSTIYRKSWRNVARMRRVVKRLATCSSNCSRPRKARPSAWPRRLRKGTWSWR